MNVQEVLENYNVYKLRISITSSEIQEMLEKLDIIEKPKEAVKINLNFPFSRNLGEEVLVVKDLVIGYLMLDLLL